MVEVMSGSQLGCDLGVHRRSSIFSKSMVQHQIRQDAYVKLFMFHIVINNRLEGSRANPMCTNKFY